MKRLLSLFALLVLCMSGAAQDFRVGRLDNGMTYYLCHNENAPACADFYIAHNVGALQEEDNQNGLAHFLEHMAFNGTRNFPGKGILDFLAREGVRFGYNVNAYTSRNETVYNISKVPLVRESFVDSVLLVLHDWSCDISCEQQALDDERGVISEEWRLRDEPRYRMMCRQNDLLYKGAKHTNRTVLGTYEVINNFKREEILDFYHKWYRPDLQAIIIVGDYDVDAMEARIRAKFSDIRSESRAQKPASYLPEPLTEPLYANQTDPQIKYQVLKVAFKQAFLPFEERSGEGFYRDLYCRRIVSSVLSDRLQRLTKDKSSAVNSCVLVTNEYTADYYVSLITASPRQGKNADCLELIEREVQRLLRHGISQEEFIVAKMGVTSLMHLDRAVDESMVTNEVLVKCCIENFLRNKPLWGPAELSVRGAEIMDSITNDEVQPYIQLMFRDSGIIYSNCCNERKEASMPSYDQMRSIVARVHSEQIPSDYLSYRKMNLDIERPAGRIVSEKTLKGSNIECWKLSNGVMVYFRPSTPVHSNVHTKIVCEFPAGYRAFDPSSIKAVIHSNNFIRRFVGAGGLERKEFKNDPQVTSLGTILTAGRRNNRFEISVGQDQLEEAFRYANKQIAEPFFPDSAILEKFNSEALRRLATKKSNRINFNNHSQDVKYGNNPWYADPDSAAIQTVNMDFVRDTWQRAFGDVASMQVFICSDADPSLIRDYVERCLASLDPGTPCSLAADHPLIPVYKGRVVTEAVYEPVSAPVCNISYNFSCRVKPSEEVRLTAAILDHILSDRYLNVIREQRGGTYHVHFETNINDNPSYPIESAVAFQTRPEMREILLKDVEDIMGDFVANGPTADELDRAVKYLKKHRVETRARLANSVSLKLYEAQMYVKYGQEYDYDYNALIDRITRSGESVRRFAARLARGNRYIEIYTEE